MFKRCCCLILALLALSLFACGSSPAPAHTESPAPTPAREAPAGMHSVLPGMEAEEQSSEAEELARSLIGSPLSLLTEKIGEPLSAEYAPSCLGSGEDGELVYEGFTVYTYREGENERIEDVVHAD